MRLNKISQMINLRIQKTQLIKSKEHLREKLKKDNDGNNNKLRNLGDRSRRDNLRFDGIEEWEEESWVDTEQNLKDTLGDILGIQNVKIERAHRVGDKKRSPCRTKVAKLSNFKTKEPKLFKFMIFRKPQ